MTRILITGSGGSSLFASRFTGVGMDQRAQGTQRLVREAREIERLIGA